MPSRDKDEMKYSSCQNNSRPGQQVFQIEMEQMGDLTLTGGDTAVGCASSPSSGVAASGGGYETGCPPPLGGGLGDPRKFYTFEAQMMRFPAILDKKYHPIIHPVIVLLK